MKNLIRLNNMTTLSPIEQIMESMSRWDNVFDFSPAFNGVDTKDKWPKYTILRDKKDENKFKIMIAAAGLDKKCFKVTSLKNKLCVSYDEDHVEESKSEEEQYEVISNTIAKRKFTQYFTAPEGQIVKVAKAEIKDGMLEIYAETEIPEDMKEVEYEIK